MAKPIPELSAVMPAYNEEEVLPVALAEATTALEEICETWELVVVDDGSTDGTAEILRRTAESDGRVRVVTQEENSGYSRALIRGFASCRYETIFYTDADAQFDLREITALYPRLAEVDMVAGYRVERDDRWIRLLTSEVYNRLQGRLLGLRVRDVNCAFKLFRRAFFDRVQLSSDGFLIDAELYARAKRAGLTWTQVGVRHRARKLGTTTVRTSTVVQTLRRLWGLKRRLEQEASGQTDSEETHPAPTR